MHNPQLLVEVESAFKELMLNTRLTFNPNISDINGKPPVNAASTASYRSLSIIDSESIATAALLFKAREIAIARDVIRWPSPAA